MILNLISVIIFLCLWTTHTSVRGEPYGEELFQAIFGIDPTSTSACELCDDWEHITTSTNIKSVADTISSTVTDNLSNLSDQLEPISQWLHQYEDYRNYLSYALGSLVVVLLLLKLRGWISLKGSCSKPQEKQKKRKTIQKLNVEKDLCQRKTLRHSQDSDKLRKTKKPKTHMISKQGLMILKKMRQGSGDNATFDIITQEHRRFISLEPELSTDKMRVFDLRETYNIPENVMQTLLCIDRNCTKHPHQHIQKYGCKIVCDPKAFGLEQDSKSKSCQADKPDFECTVDCIGNKENFVQNKSLDITQDDDDENRYTEIGPPCASSSFISNTSSMTITCEQHDSELSDVFDPFSYLDETSSANTSQLQKYLEDSISWFGGLYNYTLDTSLTNLNQSITSSLKDLDKSFDVSEVQKDLSLYGFEPGNVFHLGVICLAKQFITHVKQTWLANRYIQTTDDVLDSNSNQNTELDSFGFAVYDSRYYDE